MPVDTSADYYAWYMSEDPASRIVAFEWRPEGQIVSSMSLGNLYFRTREEPTDEWKEQNVSELPWVVAQTFCRQQGFNVEVAMKKEAAG
jgi:hypothetical protein